MEKLSLLSEENIDDIASGAGILGTGGGGDPHLGSLMAKHAIKRFGSVEVVQPEDIDDDALVVPISMIGAPTVSIEKFLSYSQIDLAIEGIESYFGKKVAAVFPIEIGGSNSMIPIIAAAKLRLPVVDCDAMGRAFPEAQMVTFYLDGLTCAPNVLVDERGNRVILEPIDGVWAEKLARPIVDEMGGEAMICDYPMSGADMKRSALPGTLSLAWKLGRARRERTTSSPVQSIINYLNGYQLLQGKIVDVERKTEGGFTRGKLKIRGLSDEKQREVNVHFQNELLLAEEASNNNRLLAMTPDMISVLDLETGKAITTENLHYGQRVILIAYPCDPKWRTEKGISVVGPRYFGYGFDYQKVEDLMGERI